MGRRWQILILAQSLEVDHDYVMHCVIETHFNFASLITQFSGRELKTLFTFCIIKQQLLFIFGV